MNRQTDIRTLTGCPCDAIENGEVYDERYPDDPYGIYHKDNRGDWSNCGTCNILSFHTEGHVEIPVKEMRPNSAVRVYKPNCFPWVGTWDEYYKIRGEIYEEQGLVSRPLTNEELDDIGEFLDDNPTCETGSFKTSFSYIDRLQRDDLDYFACFESRGCYVSVLEGVLFDVPMMADGSPEREGGRINWNEVTAPDLGFLHAVNRHFSTQFRMHDFSGR